jgi:imidazolonepropionase-like amidohydrolase
MIWGRSSCVHTQAGFNELSKLRTIKKVKNQKVCLKLHLMKKQIYFLSFLVLFLFLFPWYQKSGASTTEGDTIALVKGTLIDGTGAPPLINAVVIVKNELITAAGNQENTEIPRIAKIIDLQGGTVLPGFINSHIHRGYNEFNLKTWAKTGVTTVRDLGGNPRSDLFTFRNKVLKDPQYARLVAAGPMVTVLNGYPTVPWGTPTALPVISPDDARKKVNQLLDDGADIIKIALESGECFNLKIPMLSLEEAKAIVEVAHKRGTIVSAHVLVSKDLEYALNAGVDDIAHMVIDNPSDNIIKRVVNDGVYWEPTLELWHGVRNDLVNVAIENLSRFVKAGGRVALGTDYEGYNSKFDLGMPIREIRWMKAAGMSPMQIIVAATKNAAHVCNLEEKIGTIEKGKIADILIVNGNPLKNINALLNVRMVMHGGEIIRESN